MNEYTKRNIFFFFLFGDLNAEQYELEYWFKHTTNPRDYYDKIGPLKQPKNISNGFIPPLIGEMIQSKVIDKYNKSFLRD